MTVYLVGAGPGDADLLTVRAARILALADVVVFDRLVDSSVFSLIPERAERIDVGKRPGASHTQELINELLISLGERHACVVRLKGGDPLLFGRGGEESEALCAAGIAVEIVPGISSSLSGPLGAGIPVTHRGISRGVTIVTGHAHDGERIDFTRLAHEDLTLVILMGVADRAEIASQLRSGGLSGSTPVAVIESAWTKDQRIVRASLADLGHLPVHNPAVIVVGAVAAMDVGKILSAGAS